MIDAVFISDLHLHPQQKETERCFYQFCDWAASNTRTLYILGDFFHVWPGDEALDEWSRAIAARLATLAATGVSVYFMHGNRDFLLGDKFRELANLTMLSDSTVVTFHDQRILLSHGDRFCTQDKSHQWLRRFTRNAFFPRFFLKIPYKIRVKLVQSVRQHSQKNRQKPASIFQVVPSVMLKHMKAAQTKILIHGHTHQPGMISHIYEGEEYQQYVLSDWDDKPKLLCYHKSDGFYLELFSEYKNARSL